MQTPSMAKDKTFNLRLDEVDRTRLDAIAQHYSAPAATAVRILIKREFDRIIAEEIRTQSPEDRALAQVVCDTYQAGKDPKRSRAVRAALAAADAAAEAVLSKAAAGGYAPPPPVKRPRNKPAK